MESIKIENLSFKYPGEEKKAIQNVSLTVKQGEFITICGKSGCGKSTLLRQMKPVLAPHGERQGNIYLEGREIFSISQKEQSEKIGFVFQNPDNQIVTDKVWHELAFGLESLAYSKKEIRMRVSEMASFFGIGDWFYKKVTELSGGQKQLLNLASVMVMQPRLLILDEPTSQLDPIASQDFLETVYKINRELGVTVILSEHKLEEAFPLSDRIVVMEEGKIIADDTAQSVGNVLYKTDNEMFYALPTPMRIYYSKENTNVCPITVRDARRWLSEIEFAKKIDVDDTAMKNSGREVLSLSDVWFRYERGGGDVLKGLSLSVNDGEIYAIVGGNGSGKTTALSVISGIERQYRGKVNISSDKKVAALPQNPQSLFVKKTVELDLFEMLSEERLSREEKEKQVQSVVEFCELGELLDRHPYDLSGGEQQRAALAKVLLAKPDILLLDEPTKGMDAHFKSKLANMLKRLKNSGVTILIVSHDIEFCAKYADRCGLFFDGAITSEDTPRSFFSGKNFYTTSANKIARGFIENAVLDEDIIKAIGGKIKEKKEKFSTPYTAEKNEDKKPCKPAKLSAKRIIIGIVFAALFLCMQLAFVGEFNNLSDYIYQSAGLVLLGVSLNFLIPQRKIGLENIQMPKDKRNISKRTIVAAVMILLLIPLTIFAGVYYLGDRKYYFISLLIVLETMLPFTFVFEGRKPKAREIVIISVLCAIAVSGRTAFYALPQFKPVVALVIISGVCFGGEAGFVVGAITGFVSNFFLGQTPFTPWQMFAFGIIGFLAGILFRKGILRKTKAELCIFGFIATLIIYGGIMNPASVITGHPNPTWKMIASAFAVGFPYDVVHAISTAFFLCFISEPMIEKLDRIRVKYGLVE